jgi:hypothetical protein
MYLRIFVERYWGSQADNHCRQVPLLVSFKKSRHLGFCVFINIWSMVVGPTSGGLYNVQCKRVVVLYVHHGGTWRTMHNVVVASIVTEPASDKTVCVRKGEGLLYAKTTVHCSPVHCKSPDSNRPCSIYPPDLTDMREEELFSLE